ncbi:uncharacterized protein LOC128875783 [Hylaeus volcanicus]|uniref:uncharacterized protein LOC128875783 n=1 Tax=Hylaeus volcanicus TaxID=313075 RepID=UPI0023B81DBC|nr:uncharacterized protein LOC128875783 [Hylaeus volcanicus]
MENLRGGQRVKIHLQANQTMVRYCLCSSKRIQFWMDFANCYQKSLFCRHMRVDERLYTAIKHHVARRRLLDKKRQSLVFRGRIRRIAEARPKLLHQRKNLEITNGCWFIQDGAPLWRPRKVLEAINQQFGNNVVTLGYPNHYPNATEWPHYSPDSSSCGFFTLVL